MGAEEESYLIEVVMVELPKLRKDDSRTADMVYKLFKDTSSIVKVIEESEDVALENVKKGVGDMTYTEMALKEEKERADKAEREKEELAEKNMALAKENAKAQEEIARLKRQLHIGE